MRESIKPGEMCALALRFLATGESFRSLHFQFRLGRATITGNLRSLHSNLRGNGPNLCEDAKFKNRMGTNFR